MLFRSQLLLEILDLEVCDFIQYRPGPPEEFQVTEVVRDREWFREILPVAQAFWTTVLDRRAHGLCEVVSDNEECLCEIISDHEDEVSTLSETRGTHGSDMSVVSTESVCDVHPTGNARVSEPSPSETPRTYNTRSKARQSCCIKA